MILVTGGTGLVGSHLLYKLIEQGETPCATYRNTKSLQKIQRVFAYYSDEPLLEKIKWIKADILDYHSVMDALDNIDKVFHTAAIVSFQSSDKQSLVKTNVEGTANIVNACVEKKIKKLVHVSSIGALGRAGSDGVVTEENHWNGKKSSAYSTSKYLSEMEVWRAVAEGLDAVIINPSIILGPGDWNTGSSKLFNSVYGGLKFYTTGTNGFVDVNDVAEIMIKLMNSDIVGERFIVNSENINYKDLFLWMADALNVSRPKYRAGKNLSEVVWRLLAIKTIITGKRSSITRETAETANQLYYYSNNKIVETIGHKFIPVKESVCRNAVLFLKDCSKK